MGTRGTIGVLYPNGSVDCSYVHYDSYPAGVGMALFEKVKTNEDFVKLAKAGARSSLNFDDPVGHVNEIYGDEPCRHFDSLEEYQHYMADPHSELEYNYLFDIKEHKLKVATEHNLITHTYDEMSGYLGRTDRYVQLVDQEKDLIRFDDLFDNNGVPLEVQREIGADLFPNLAGAQLQDFSEALAYECVSCMNYFREKAIEIPDYLDYLKEKEEFTKDCLEKGIISQEQLDRYQQNILITKEGPVKAEDYVLQQYANVVDIIKNDICRPYAELKDQTIKEFENTVTRLGPEDTKSLLQKQIKELGVKNVKVSKAHGEISVYASDNLSQEDFDKVIDYLDAVNEKREHLYNFRHKLYGYLDFYLKDECKQELEQFKKQPQVELELGIRNWNKLSLEMRGYEIVEKQEQTQKVSQENQQEQKQSKGRGR